MKGSILSKTSAQLPDEDGNFGPPGSEKVAVLLLSAKFNHPLGFFSPLAKEVGEFAASMNKELDDANSQDNGCESSCCCDLSSQIPVSSVAEA